MGLDPGTPGSPPGLKAALNRRATRAARIINFKDKVLQHHIQYTILCNTDFLYTDTNHMSKIVTITQKLLKLFWYLPKLKN